ncbi:MAG TPA: SAM-dependent methyltransferase, partial [Sphingomicrobium sp.]|nr:SAM-dependent methyltransferase [Sphingomicrobium sp.]
HPEVLYRARPSVIAEAVDLQRRLFDRAATLVRPGGSLVYAVCSLEPEEGEAQVTSFLSRQSDFRLVPGDAGVPGLPATADGWLRTVPGNMEAEGGLDGFFAAHLVRGG